MSLVASQSVGNSAIDPRFHCSRPSSYAELETEERYGEVKVGPVLGLWVNLQWHCSDFCCVIFIHILFMIYIIVY